MYRVQEWRVLFIKRKEKNRKRRKANTSLESRELLQKYSPGTGLPKCPPWQPLAISSTLRLTSTSLRR
jgi:hypothetical protein